MKIIKIKVADIGSKVRLLTIEGNRDISKRKDLIESLKKHGIMVPPLVIKADSPLLAGYKLYDITTGREVQTIKSNDYVVLDGQHRVNNLLALFLIEKELEEKNDKEIGAYVKKLSQHDNIQEPTQYKSQCIESFEMRILEDKEVKGFADINDYIREINNTSKQWKNEDYIKSAFVKNADNKLMAVIYLFQELGLSLSAIARYLTREIKGITKDLLSDSTNRNITLAYYHRGLMFFTILITMGFSKKLVCSRYLIDIILEIWKNTDSHEIAVDHILNLDTEHVKQINDMKSSSLANNEHIAIIKANYAKKEKNGYLYHYEFVDETLGYNICMEYLKKTILPIYSDKKLAKDAHTRNDLCFKDIRNKIVNVKESEKNTETAMTNVDTATDSVPTSNPLFDNDDIAYHSVGNENQSSTESAPSQGYTMSEDNTYTSNTLNLDDVLEANGPMADVIGEIIA